MALAVALTLTLTGPTRAESTAREYDLKAAFLFNFSQFVEWPPWAMSSTNAPFVLGVLGQDPFGTFLDDVVKNERVHGRPIVVRRFATAAEASSAQILFISRSEQVRMGAVLEQLRGQPVLTVADTADRWFIRNGGMIALFTENNKIRLRINLDAARAAQLTISAKLLRLAQTVVESEGR